MADRVEVIVSVELHPDEYMSSEEQAIANVATILNAHIPMYYPLTSDTASYRRYGKKQGNALELLAQIFWNQPLLDGVAKVAIMDFFDGDVPKP